MEIEKSCAEYKTPNIVNNLPIVKDFENVNRIVTVVKSPKHTKRKIINSYFDHKIKRKFPGPAGILSEKLEEPKDESICQIELLSQVIYLINLNLYLFKHK